MAAGEPLGSREWSAEAVALGVGVGAARMVTGEAERGFKREA